MKASRKMGLVVTLIFLTARHIVGYHSRFLVKYSMDSLVFLTIECIIFQVLQLAIVCKVCPNLLLLRNSEGKYSGF